MAQLILIDEINLLFENFTPPAPHLPIFDVLKTFIIPFFKFNTEIRKLTNTIIELDPLMEGPWGKELTSHFELVRQLVIDYLLPKQVGGEILP